MEQKKFFKFTDSAKAEFSKWMDQVIASIKEILDWMKTNPVEAKKYIESLPQQGDKEDTLPLLETWLWNGGIARGGRALRRTTAEFLIRTECPNGLYEKIRGLTWLLAEALNLYGPEQIMKMIALLIQAAQINKSLIQDTEEE